MRQRGFSSILLIVIVVTLASMTAFALRFVSGAQGGAAVQLQAMRVQRAAEAAVEWQRYRLLTLAQPTGCVATATNLNIPLGSGNMPVTVTCSPTPGAVHTESGKSVYSYTFVVKACWPAGPGGVCPNPAPPSDYVARSVTVTGACIQAVPLSSCTW